jgi:hypothetical protein
VAPYGDINEPSCAQEGLPNRFPHRRLYYVEPSLNTVTEPGGTTRL